MIRVISLFDGIAGFPLGLKRTGMTTVCGVEIDPYCNEVVRRNQANGNLDAYPVWSDVADFDAEAWHGRADLLTAGWPCQGNSVAGKRHGLKDDRSALFWQVIRILRDCRPRWFLGENVPGLFSVNGGLDFLEVLRALDECGYGLSWGVLNARYFGVAQTRQRVFLVGHLGAPCPPEILFEPEGSRRDLEACGEPWAYPATKSRSRSQVVGCLGDLGNGRPDDNDAQGGYLIAPCLAGRQGRLDPTEEAFVARTLSGGSNPNSNAAGRRREDDVNLVLQPSPKCLTPFDLTTKRIHSENGIAPTLSGCDGKGGQRTMYVAHSLTGEGHDANEDGTGRGVPLVAHPLRAGRHIADSNGDPGNVIMDSMLVRRLTPIECERLMGFPDGWTHGADTRRYRALGNSVVVPVIEWIGRRIMEAVK